MNCVSEKMGPDVVFDPPPPLGVWHEIQPLLCSNRNRVKKVNRRIMALTNQWHRSMNPPPPPPRYVVTQSMNSQNKTEPRQKKDMQKGLILRVCVRDGGGRKGGGGQARTRRASTLPSGGHKITATCKIYEGGKASKTPRFHTLVQQNDEAKLQITQNYQVYLKRGKKKHSRTRASTDVRPTPARDSSLLEKNKTAHLLHLL